MASLIISVSFPSTAARLLGAGEMWQDGGVCGGAEPQVSQHLHHQDTGHVGQGGETDTIPALAAAPRVTYLLWYNSWGWLDAIGVFYTRTGWISSNQRFLHFYLYLNIIIIIVS